MWLRRDETEGGRYVFEIEHVQSGARARARNLAELNQWLFNVAPAEEAAPATGDKPAAGCAALKS
jgi:hypothetical protein